MPKPLPKLTQIRVNVSKDVDIQKLIGQVHTFIAKSKMSDRIEVYLNGDVSSPSTESPVPDEDMALL